MRRWCVIAVVMASICGCGEDADIDDVAKVKQLLPMDQVPAAVLKAAKHEAPGLTFFAASTGTYQGQKSIELRGRTKSGQIKEVAVSPEGKVLGFE